MVNKYRFIACLMILLTAGAFVISTNPGLSAFRSAANKLKNDPDLSHGMLGIYVYDTKKDSVLYDLNGNMGLVPASSQKTLTTAAALCIFGDDYTFETRIEYDGVLDTVSGLLKGDLYIHGSGDPTLDSKYFHDEKDTLELVQQWAGELKKKGIRRIEGRVIADASIFEDEMTPSTWIWGDMGNYYGAGACGLTFKDNLYTLFFKTGNAGDSARIGRMEPRIPGMRIVNKVRAGGSGDNCYIFGGEYSNERYATGTVPAGQSAFEVNGSMPDPAWFCAWSLDTALKTAGILITGKPATVRELKLEKKYSNTPRHTLLSHLSPPLSQIVYWTNKRSINLYAECLLKAIAVKLKSNGDEEVGTSALTEYWQNKGMNTGGMHLNDGCGLSRWNSVTPKQFATLMKLMAKETSFKSFFASLPVQSTGVSAKSGYIGRVRSYAGYVTKKNGDLIVFSMIANNYDCSAGEMRVKLEKLMEALALVE
jgi:D-alanyl-D-alanine carboxypeptidase/D-alanyl-D-alanine-endopeptidase (penicillin-binding protein 4)